MRSHRCHCCCLQPCPNLCCCRCIVTIVHRHCCRCIAVAPSIPIAVPPSIAIAIAIVAALPSCRPLPLSSHHPSLLLPTHCHCAFHCRRHHAVHHCRRRCCCRHAIHCRCTTIAIVHLLLPLRCCGAFRHCCVAVALSIAVALVLSIAIVTVASPSRLPLPSPPRRSLLSCRPSPLSPSNCCCALHHHHRRRIAVAPSIAVAVVPSITIAIVITAALPSLPLPLLLRSLPTPPSTFADPLVG